MASLAGVRCVRGQAGEEVAHGEFLGSQECVRGGEVAHAHIYKGTKGIRV